MRKRFTVIIISALALVGLLFTACPTDPDLAIGGGAVGDPWGSPPFSGERQGFGQGYGGMVGVTITLVDGFITAVDFNLDVETPHFVRVHPDRIRPIVLQTNSFDAVPVHIIAGASMTTVGIITAGNAALATIPGVGEE